MVAIALLVLSACRPPITSVDAEDLVEALGPALAEVFADGELSQEEHLARNQFNECPNVPPEIGTDENQVTWSPDLLLGFIPNPLHAPFDCYRGTSEELGLSSFQCCYDGDELISGIPQEGSFDFVNPYTSLRTAILHFLLDMNPESQYGG